MEEIKILHNVIITGNVLELKRFLKFELNKGQLEYNFSRANEPGPYIHLLQWELHIPVILTPYTGHIDPPDILEGFLVQE